MRLVFFLALFLSIFYSCRSNDQVDSHPDISEANKVKFDFKMDFDSTNKINIKSVEISDLKSVSRLKKLIT